MARPVGRYFASVITKIRDVRKKEQIVVDDTFKMQLRQKLMMKAAAQVGPQKTNWVSRLEPFKMYFAMVPALALLIVAVVGISKLPIQIKSPIVVPTSDLPAKPNLITAEERNGVHPLAQNINPLTNIQISEEHVGNVSDASPVQPAVIQPMVQLMVQPSPAPQALKSTGSAATPAPKPKPKAQAKAQVSPAVDAVQPEADIPPSYEEFSYFDYLVPLSYQFFYPSTAMQPSSAPLTPSVSGQTPTYSPGSSSSVSGMTPSISTSTDNRPMNPVIVQPKFPLSKTVLAPYVPTGMTLNMIALLPPGHVDAPIRYNGTFSSDERMILEQNLLPALVGNNQVYFIAVSQPDPATIVIELDYSNGQVVVYHYRVDESGTWLLMNSAIR